MQRRKPFNDPLVRLLKNTSPEKGEILEKSLDYAAGFETRLTNPDYLLTKKNEDVTFYDQMLLDDVISSTIELKKRMTLSVPFDIKAASEEQQDIERAEFVSDMLDNMKQPFKDIIDNFLDAQIYGYKCGEIIWQIREGKWVWENIKCKHSYFFDFDYDKFGNLETLEIGYYIGNNKKITGIDNILNKFILFSYPYIVDGNYYGESDLNNLYMLWNQKQNIYKWRGMYLQGYGMPIPVVKYDYEKLSSSEKNDLVDMLDNFQDNMYVLVPSVRNKQTGELMSKFEIDFRQVGAAGTSGGTPYDTSIEQINTDMKRKLLIPDKTGYTNSDGGSYALGAVQFDVLRMVISDLHTKIENLFNPYIKRLVDFNFPSNGNYPYLKFQSIDDALETELLRLLIDSKIIDPAEKWIRSRLRIPELSQKESEELEEIKEERAEEAIKTQQSIMAGTVDKKDTVEKEAMKAEKEYPTTPINFKKIDSTLKKYEDEFVSAYNDIHRQQSERIVSQVQKKKIIENKDLKTADSLRIQKGDFKNLFATYYSKLYVYGKTTGIDESQKKIDKSKKFFQSEYVEDNLEWLDRKWVDDFLKEYGALGKLTKEDIDYLKTLRDYSFSIAGDTESRMVKNTLAILKEGIRSGEPVKTTITKIEQKLSDDRKRYATTIARTNQADAFNNGRMNLFRSNAVRPYIEAYQYSAVLDNVTTDFCRYHDGQIIMADDPKLATVNPPNHPNCRSVLIPIFRSDANDSEAYYGDYQNQFDSFGKGVPESASQPAPGFGGSITK